ncbi:MAG: rRNA maturation RNase YbeY [Patescibacteria group bacterium]
MSSNLVTVYGLNRRPQLAKKVEKITQSVLGHFHVREKTMDIIFLGNKEMVALKKKHVKKSGPANTLSFGSPKNFPHPEDRNVPLGEVFVNTDITNYRLPSIAPLLIHSILHLLGYHHEDGRDKIEMDRLAKRVMRALKSTSKNASQK